MNFFKILLTLIFLLFSTATFSDNHKTGSNVELSDEAKQMLEELEEEVPLNDPFAGNEGTAGGAVDPSISQEEQEDEMSLYKYKLAGLISGKDNSYISLVNSSGEVISLTIGQYLGKIKLVDLRLDEAIFEKDDEKFIIIDFNNSIREADEY
jgi:Tfp pilus assembly protein PilP